MTSGACVTKQTVPASTKWLLTWWKSEDGCCCIFKCCTVVTLTRIVYFSLMPKSLTWKSMACSNLQKCCQIIKQGLSVSTRLIFAGFFSPVISLVIMTVYSPSWLLRLWQFNGPWNTSSQRIEQVPNMFAKSMWKRKQRQRVNVLNCLSFSVLDEIKWFS